jgi:tetraacyldisaccharide 4'-kinase
MYAPKFWARDPGLTANLLSPAAALYAAAGALRRRFTRPMRPPVPVICIGNLVAGGAGKTPTALALGRRLAGWGLEVGYLSRGYGGSLRGPAAVDTQRHDAGAVGDEPLLLAAVAPTWVARERRAAAWMAIAGGSDVLILDDGYQNPSLAKDLSLVVVDGGAGFGNRRVIPAGPLREPIGAGLARADAVVIVGEDRCGLAAECSGKAPVLTAKLVPDRTAHHLHSRKVLAFAGIGRPEKFFATLEALGARMVERYAFPDHHRYSEDEIMRLVEAAQRAGAIAVTTEKDFVRLPKTGRPMITPVAVELVFDDYAALDALVKPVLARYAAERPAPRV